MIKKFVLEYERNSEPLFLSEKSKEHIQNIKKEIKYLVKDEIKEFLQTEKGQKLVKEFVSDIFSQDELHEDPKAHVKQNVSID